MKNCILIILIILNVSINCSHSSIENSQPLINEKKINTINKNNFELLMKLHGTYPIMIQLPGGSFDMGLGNHPSTFLHNVTVSPFEISATEVTQKQYEKVMGYNPSYFAYNDKKPVENISWYEAAEYCARLNLIYNNISIEQREKILEFIKNIDNKKNSIVYYQKMSDYIDYTFTKEGNGLFRLPSEAEWEYAARGGKQYEYGTYNGIISIENAVYNSEETSSVGTKMPNPFGLFDTAGNVMEWCADKYDGDYYKNSPRNNPLNLKKYNFRVVRDGGCAKRNKKEFLVSNRRSILPETRFHFTGFRIAK